MSGPRERDRITGELAALGEAPAKLDERGDAVSLARLVDDMLEGRAAPPAMDAEERALLETATQEHASCTTKAHRVTTVRASSRNL